MSQYIVHKAVDMDKLSAKRRPASVAGWNIQPKYDGCQAIFYFRAGRFVSCRSRTNEEVYSMDHVGEELARIYADHLELTKEMAIVGEAWIPQREFSYISGVFRRHSAQPELCFMPFDILHAIGSALSSPYKQRYRQEKLFRRTPYLSNSTVLFPVARPVKDMDEAIELARMWKESGIGYDGAVLYNPDALYKVGSGSGGEIIKVKPNLSKTLRCLRVEEGKGKFKGMVGSLICSYQGRELGVGGGVLTTAERRMYWLAIAKDGGLAGKLVEVEAMGLSSDGLLREPRFKGIRTDVLNPDD